MDRDEVLVKLVELESIIWKRNHSQFKNVTMKEQAWGRVSYQLGISSESFSLLLRFYFLQRTNTSDPQNHRSIVSTLSFSHLSVRRHSPGFSPSNEVSVLIQLLTHTCAPSRGQFLPDQFTDLFVAALLVTQLSSYVYRRSEILWQKEGVRCALLYCRGCISVCE
jgi:Alcohol dehydrogenase transcription factor Myb/SANT-like